MSTSLRAALREATHDTHQRLDAAFGGAALGAARLEGLLRAHYEVLSWLEPALAATASFRQALPDLAGRQKLPWLLSDLADLGAGDLTVGRPFPIEHAAAAFGASYVVEGSTLGGAGLARAFGASLPPDVCALRYLNAYGERRGPMWTAFVAALDAFGERADEAERAHATASARRTFEAFENAFCAQQLISPA